MTEERITETTDASGNTHTTHTVVTESEKGRINWIVVLLVLGVAFVGVVFLTQVSDAEVAKDNAIAGAAEEVGAAAEQVGEAAQNAGDAGENAVNE